MTFEEAGSRYAQLKAQYQAGQLSPAAFHAAAVQLAVVDPNGDWWQVEPTSGEWLRWNGSEWVRQPQSPVSAESGAPSPQPQRQYALAVVTQDYRTQLKSGGEDSLWIYASVCCTDPAVDCAGLAGVIQFHLGGANPEWLTLGPPAPIGGTLAVRVTSLAPDPSARLRSGGAAVVAAATIEGQAVSVEATIEIIADTPAEETEYELAPLVWGFQEIPRARSRKRSYKGQELDEYDLVADGADELNIAAAFVRRDLIEEGAEPAGYIASAANFVRIRKIELAGEGSAEFAVTPMSDATGVVRVNVKSKRPLLATETNGRIDVTLVIEGEIPPDAGGRYVRREVSASVPLRLKLLFLKLIVVPGTSPGVSEAWAHVGVAPDASGPLKDIACQLDLASLGRGPSIVPLGDAVRRTNENGLAGWTFEYKGLNWNNLGEARFRVRAGIKCPAGPPEEAAWVEIDAGANIRKFLTALAAAAGQLDLTNSSVRSRGGILEIMWPDSLTGPLNDVSALAGVPGSGARYTSSEMRNRIWDFALARRYANDVETASSMNGVDFGKHELGGIHAGFAYFPAGSGDPHFIDPWWDQAFHPDKVLLTRADEAARLRACTILLQAVGAAVLLKMGVFASAAAGLAAIRSWFARGVAGEQRSSDIGAYREAPANWGESFFEGAVNERKSGAVAPIENW